MRRVGVCVLFIVLIVSFPLSAQSDEDNVKTGENTESIQSSSEWEQEIYEELSRKMKAANMPLKTLKFVLSRIDRDTLPKDRKQALDKIFDLTKKYDLELRRGKSYSSVALELKRELALSKKNSDKTKIISVKKVKDKTDKIAVKEKEDKEIKEVKEKIKEIEEVKEVKEKIKTK
ncbi:MAG: hypothetical protein JW822_06490 [Spirochaetales bacterium]|nr:hypothetical protein [Spirochaetales bacterium]